MKFAHLLASLTEEPLFLTPAKAQTIIDLVRARAVGEASGTIPTMHVAGNAAATDGEPGVARYFFGEDEEPSEPPPLYTTPYPGVAVIQVEGVISKRLSGMAARCGGYDLDTLAAALRAALADGNIEIVVLDINSPGGTGIGLPEVSTLIEQVRASKPVLMFSDYQVCSAAYWIGAQCDEMFTTPSAMVGSIGAYLAAIDQSKAFEMQGLERLVFNGNADYKAMGLPGKKWTPEEKAFMEARAAKATADIRAAAQANRTLDLADMQGQVFDGGDALAKNLVDGLVDSREEFLAMVAGIVKNT